VTAPKLAGLALLVAIIALLQVLVSGGVISPFVVAAPSAIAEQAWLMLLNERLVQAFLSTSGLVFGALVLATVVGVGIGYLLFRSRVLGEAFQSWLAAAFSAPIVLLYPIFLVLFGRTPLMILVMGFLVAIIPVALKTLEGFRAVPGVQLSVARTFNATEWQTFAKVLLPSALPALLTGIRLSFIYTMINVIAIEYLVDFGGLGFLVGEMYDRYNIAGMYAAVLSVIFVTMIYFALVGRLSRLVDRRAA